MKMQAHNDIRWPLPPTDYTLSDAGIHVWVASLDVSPSRREGFLSTLAPAEGERASRFRLETHRNRFIAGRGLLRAILGEYLRVEPSDLKFEYGANGKPVLSGDRAACLQFNLAHSEGLALIAVTRRGPIGVDVELVRLLPDAEQLVDRFFSTLERAAFRTLAPDQKPVAFFNLWTRKEAWLKATGEGIARALNLVEVSFLPGEEPRLLNIAGNVAQVANWRLRALTPVTRFVGALACESGNEVVDCWRWPDLVPQAIAPTRA